MARARFEFCDGLATPLPITKLVPTTFLFYLGRMLFRTKPQTETHGLGSPPHRQPLLLTERINSTIWQRILYKTNRDKTKENEVIGTNQTDTQAMFCNEMEDTLFSPIPPSLWTDYYDDERGQDPYFGDGIMRNTASLSQRRRLLPPLHHFRSLPQTHETQTTEFFEECDSIDGSSQYSRSSSSSLISSPSRSQSEKTVKSLFHDGCLFAYSPPKEQSRSIPRFQKSNKTGTERKNKKQPRLNMNGLRMAKAL